jgi:chromosome segregation ATPase
MVASGNNLTVFGCSITLFGLLLSSGALTYFFRLGTSAKTTEKTTNENKRAISELSTGQLAVVQKLQDVSSIASDAQNRLARLEPDMKVLQMDMARQQTILDEMRRQFAKLDRIDEIVTNVAQLKETVHDVMKNALVPRPELNRQFENDDRRFKRLEDDVRSLMRPSAQSDT